MATPKAAPRLFRLKTGLQKTHRLPTPRRSSTPCRSPPRCSSQRTRSRSASSSALTRRSRGAPSTLTTF
eukprot:247598-Heterocapsa_arctica.AAC.1